MADQLDYWQTRYAVQRGSRPDDSRIRMHEAFASLPRDVQRGILKVLRKVSAAEEKPLNLRRGLWSGSGSLVFLNRTMTAAAARGL